MPASPRSSPDATGKPGEPLLRLLQALEGAGYEVLRRQPVSEHGGVNPTRVDLRHGPTLTGLLIYSWFATLEGKGRRKDDFRIQTTRSHEGALMSEPGRPTVGVGWHRETEVFVAFDAWAKRFSGKSSSVHIKRSLIETAQEQGRAEEWAGLYDPRLAFLEEHAAVFVQWAHKLDRRKTEALCPQSFERTGSDTAVIVGKVHETEPGSWLRINDRILVVDDHGQITDNNIWLVRDITPLTEPTPRKRSRRLVQLSADRLGRLNVQPGTKASDLL